MSMKMESTEQSEEKFTEDDVIWSEDGDEIDYYYELYQDRQLVGE